MGPSQKVRLDSKSLIAIPDHWGARLNHLPNKSPPLDGSKKICLRCVPGLVIAIGKP